VLKLVTPEYLAALKETMRREQALEDAELAFGDGPGAHTTKKVVRQRKARIERAKATCDGNLMMLMRASMDAKREGQKRNAVGRLVDANGKFVEEPTDGEG